MRRSKCTWMWMVMVAMSGLFTLVSAEPNYTQAKDNPPVSISPEQTAWLSEHPDLKVGFTTIPPQFFWDEKTKIMRGLCIDFLDAIENRIGYRFQRIHFRTWDELMKAAFEGKIDIIYAAQKTPSREEKFLFTQPYLVFQNMIVTAKDVSDIHTLADLEDKTVAVVRGAAIEEELKRRFPQIVRIPVDDELQGLLLVSFKEANAMIIEPSRASYWIQDKQITNLHIIGSTDIIYRLGFAVRKDMPQLCNILDAGLKALPEHEKHAITNRWVEIQHRYDFTWLWWLLGGVSGAVGFIVVWNVSLRRQVASRTCQLQEELSRRQKAEIQMNLAEEQFRHIIEFCPLGIHMWEIDGAGRLILKGANTAAEKILKMDHRTLLGQEIEKAFPGLIGTDVPERYRRICTKGIPWGSDVDYSSGVIHGTYEVYAFQTAPGQMAVMFSDISGRIAAQEALRRSEAQLSSIFRASPAGIGLITDRVFKQVNDRFCEILGYTQDELLQQNSRMIYADELEYQRVGQEWYAQIQKEGMASMQMVLRHKEGRLIDVLATAAYIDETDFSRGLSFVMTDITESVRIQKELVKSEAELNSIFRAAPAAIGVAVDRVFQQVNDHMCRMLGYSREELVGNSAKILYSSQDEYDHVGQERYEQIRKTGIGTIQTQWRCKDGEIIDILLSSAAFDPADLSKGTAFIALNISEQVLAQKKLEENERLLDGIFQTAPVGLFLLDKEKRYLKINRHLAQLNNVPMEKHLGRTVAEIIPPVSPHIDELYPAVFEEGHAVFNHMTSFALPDQPGHQVYGMINVFPFRDRSGQVIAMLGSVMNVTEIKRTEIALAESERKLSTLIGNLPGIAYRRRNNRDWTVEFISQQCLKITGYSDNQFMTGQICWNDIIVPEYRENVWQDIQRALTEKSSYILEYQIQTAAGEKIWIWEQGCGIYDDAGKLLYLEGLLLDITEDKKTEETLRFFQFAVEHSGESAYWMTSDSRFVYVNQAACKELGYTQEELLTRSVADVDPDFPFDKWPQHWNELREKNILRFESHHKARDGRVFPVDISANYVKFGGTEYNCSFVRNISERKQFEQAIEAFIETVSSSVGSDMFCSFTKQLAGQLFADMVVIGQLSVAQPFTVTTLSVFKDGNVLDNFTYSLKDTPCERAIDQKNMLCVFEDSVAEVFSKDVFLSQHGIRSYIGMPLRDINHQSIGIICALFRKPLVDSSFAQGILKIYANQAAMELQRMKSQKELAVSEHRFRQMFECMGSAVAVYQAVDNGLDFVFTDFNPAAERIEKIKKEELLGCRVTEVFPGVKEFGIVDVFSHVWKTGQSARYPVKLYKDSRIVGWRENYIYKLPTGEIVALYEDVTERFKAEEVLRLTAQRNQTLLKLNQMADQPFARITDFAMEEAVRITNSKIGYLAFLNDEQTVLTMHSWSKSAMNECAMVDKPIDYPVHTTGLWGEAVRQRKPIITNDYEAPNPLKKGYPDGHVRLRRHMNVPIIVNSKVVLVAGVGNKDHDYDMTDVQQLTLLMEGMWYLIERIRSAQGREKLLKEIQAKNQELESIVFVASHDLRSPLINIQGFSGELQKSCRELTVLLGREHLSQVNSVVIRRLLDEDIPESLSFINAGAQKMDILLGGLLRLARIGVTQIHIDAIDMNRMMAMILKTVQYQMREYEIEIRLDSLPECIGDWVQLSQVFSNLIDNAIKYRHPSRKAIIEIAGQIKNGKACYTIKDNGVGIEAEHLDKIFEIFHRLNPAGPVKGEGLGLTIVRRILDRLDGKIEVTSKFGEGSIFSVSLPILKN